MDKNWSLTLFRDEHYTAVYLLIVRPSKSNKKNQGSPINNMKGEAQLATIGTRNFRLFYKFVLKLFNLFKAFRIHIGVFFCFPVAFWIVVHRVQ